MTLPKSVFQLKSEQDQFDQEIDKQIRAYEAIPLSIYSLGGIVYFVLSLLAPNLIGPAPYNFSGFIVHLLIIISFIFLSVSSYRMLYSLEHEYLTNNYIRDFNASIIGYLVVLLSILFAEDLRQIIFGLIIIFFIPITISIITYLKIYYFKNSTKIKSSFQFKSKNELPQVDREIEHQARAYEGIPLLIYSLGGIMYFLQSLLFPNLIGLGPAPYNFSGSMVHSLIILSFSILSVTGYRMIDGTLKHDYSKVKYRKDFNNSITGYLVILPVILFAIDLGLILFGLSVIFFIPVLISVFSFLKIKSFDNSFIVRSPFHIERKNKIHKVEQEIEKFDDHTSGRQLLCNVCNSAVIKNSLFCKECGIQLS